MNRAGLEIHRLGVKISQKTLRTWHQPAQHPRSLQLVPDVQLSHADRILRLPPRAQFVLEALRQQGVSIPLSM